MYIGQNKDTDGRVENGTAAPARVGMAGDGSRCQTYENSLYGSVVIGKSDRVIVNKQAYCI